MRTRNFQFGGVSNSNMSNSVKAEMRLKTSEEKLKRALAVETMYRLYKKYDPIWAKLKK